jgi:hypothetical protein
MSPIKKSKHLNETAHGGTTHCGPVDTISASCSRAHGISQSLQTSLGTSPIIRLRRFSRPCLIWDTDSVDKKNSVTWVRKRTIPTKRPPLVSEVSANFFADRGCHMVSMTNPYGHILDFLDRTYYFFQVASQLYSRGSGSVARNTEH